MHIVYTTSDEVAYALGDGSLLGFEVNSLITDRTAEDVLRWKTLHDKGWEAMTPDEQSEWIGGMKGAYNYTDMNRVEEFVRGLESRFLKKGIALSLTTKTDWKRTSRPTENDMRRYFDNVAKVRAAVVVDLNTPAVPTTATIFDYRKANDLEMILLTVGKWLDRNETSQVYSGDLYLGEV